MEDYGAPVYVRHEIVHNRHVVENLRRRGVVFVEDFDEIKDDSRPVILSAHGVPKAVETEAARRKLTVIDATCPLVAKVHRQIRKLAEEGREIVVIGKKSIRKLSEPSVRLIVRTGFTSLIPLMKP